MNPRLHIRISQNTMAFAVRSGESGLLDRAATPGYDGQVAFEPYIVKSGMSIPANLREAFRESPLLGRGHTNGQIIVDTPVLLVPIREFDETAADMLYRYAYSLPDNDGEQPSVKHSVLPSLNAVAIYAVNKDLCTVAGDNFTDVRYSHLMEPVWEHLLNRSYAGSNRKLYVYVHRKKVEVFSFEKNRFLFVNTFDVQGARDAVYFILSVWTQLSMNAIDDELYVAFETTLPSSTVKVATDDGANLSDEGSMQDNTIDLLQKYLQKVHQLNPQTEFNHAPVTLVKGMPFDLMAALLR